MTGTDVSRPCRIAPGGMTARTQVTVAGLFAALAILAAACGGGRTPASQQSGRGRSSPQGGTAPAPTVSTQLGVVVDGPSEFPAIAVGKDGLPVVAYKANDKLKVAHCDNLDCSKNSTPITDEFMEHSLGVRPIAIAIGADGMPVVVYVALIEPSASIPGDEVLKILHCGNDSCSAGNTNTVVVSGGTGTFHCCSATEKRTATVRYEVSIAIGKDGFPVVGYINFAYSSFRVLHCGNVACSKDNVHTTIDGGPDSTAPIVGYDNSITIGADGLPVLSYVGEQASLKIAHCGTATCSPSSKNTITKVDNLFAPRFTSIAIGDDGLPVVSYTVGEARGSTISKVLHCGNPSCSRNSAFATVVGGTLSESMAIGSNGLPLIVSLFDEGYPPQPVSKLIYCGNATCSSGNTTGAVKFIGGGFAVAIERDGRPVLSYIDKEGLRVARL